MRNAMLGFTVSAEVIEELDRRPEVARRMMSRAGLARLIFHLGLDLWRKDPMCFPTSLEPESPPARVQPEPGNLISFREPSA